MRILQVCDKYFPSVGGIQKYVANVSERLAKRHEVNVFTTDNLGLPRTEEINGVLVRRFRSYSPNNAYHISLGMLRELRKSEFDIVHGHNYHALPLFFSRYARRKKYILTPHYFRHGATAFRNILIRLYRPFGKKIFEEADRVVAMSNYEKCLLIEDFNIDSGKIVVIPGGVNLKEFQGLKKEEREHKTILCVARLEEFKGIQYAIQALPLLDKSTCLEIAGKGLYKEKLIRLATELGVEDRIHFYQDLHGEEMLERYANADLFVLLSRYESFGIAVAEALASRTPVIVTNIPTLKQWVDNENCFGIDYPISIDRLVSLIAKVIGKEVRGAVLWDWDDVAKHIELIYSV